MVKLQRVPTDEVALLPVTNKKKRQKQNLITRNAIRAILSDAKEHVDDNNIGHNLQVLSIYRFRAQRDKVKLQNG